MLYNTKCWALKSQLEIKFCHGDKKAPMDKSLQDNIRSRIQLLERKSV